MPVSDLPPEILDVVIDELQEDKKSLLHASLACKTLCPRTRVHLFSAVTVSSRYCCDRLRELITVSPKLALHFKTLEIMIMYSSDTYAPEVYGALTVIESLINVTRLSLSSGHWQHMPDTVVSSLQSHSYRTLDIFSSFRFRSIGEICSLVQNSPNLQQVRIMSDNPSMREECNLNHSLHCTPALVLLHIDDCYVNSDSAGNLLKLVISPGPCPFFCSNIHILSIALPDKTRTIVPQLNQYLAVSRSSLKHLVVSHLSGFRDVSSETLNITGVEHITVRILDFESTPRDQASRIFTWWISNLSAVDEHCTIRSVSFAIMSVHQPEGHPALDWEDLWMRLDECLASYKMALLKRVAVTFEPRPSEWDTLKDRMEGNFPRLKRLGREVVFDATT
ncbi:uncharacterized protein EV420DRAFT_1508870 [Desarmillaria tabescens]|uniref:Uncharacterized protein n=1 Tax=Armillaria tabescens TaxID=1929756 RepID=A0AA39NHV5_ARMTA|nr:uncharacterized protein EV420DRAFT_1508870 [Desarmillaria tabescens]KAK0465936.1 hypothetical protein EV420DRAFT_1508870 [Desarmillaria tabescens]